MMSKALIIGVILAGSFAVVYGALSLDLHRKLKTKNADFESVCGVSEKEVKSLYIMGILSIIGGIFAIGMASWMLLPKGHKDNLRGMASRFAGYNK